MRASSSSTQMPAGIRFFFTRIFPLIFLVVGAVVALFGFQSVQKAEASVNWPKAEGVVVSASVEYHDSDEGSGTYHAEILYDFTVGGKVFSGNRVAYGDFGSSNSSHARGIVNRYPKGTSVAVYYMPDDPTECLLEPGLKGQAWFMPGLGLVFFLAGAVMAVFLPRALRNQDLEQGSEGFAGDMEM